MADKRTTILLDPDLLKEIQHQKVDGVINSVTEFIKSAVSEKLDRAAEDPKRVKLLSLYDGLNEYGRDWLIECAQIAASCDTTRIVNTRKQDA